jgi:hypothetical protein
LPSTTPGDDLRCVFIPGDAASAAKAGVEFARALAGAPSDAFLLALAEQRGLIRQAVWHVGCSLHSARRTADAFEQGAKAEWQRLTAQVSPTLGRA